jgi:hypothetical protein
MYSRRLLHLEFFASLRLLPLAALMLTAAGCLTTHSASAPPPASPPMASPPSTRPDSMDASSASPAEMIAHRAESYTKEMAPAIARRDAGTEQSAAEPSTAESSSVQPSMVQWGTTPDNQLSLLPSYLLRSESAPSAPASVEASPSSANEATNEATNQATGQLASMKTDATSNSVRAPTPPPEAAKPQVAANQPVPSDAMPLTPVADSSSETQAQTGEPESQTLGALNARLAKRVNDYPHDISAQFDFQLMQFMMDEPVPNLSTLSSLSDEDREMLSAIMDGLSNYRNNLRADNNMLLSRKVRPLLEMSDRLRSLADLTIPTLALCSEVKGFGNYTPFDGDPPHFSAGVDHPVLLYCEVQNFSSQLNDAKMWQTALDQDAVLYTEGGMAVWNDKTQAVNDTARNRRQDFFIVQRMRLPSTLPIGRYLLKVTIEDKQSHHVAESTQPLLIVAE